jgi:hypothetical protein
MRKFVIERELPAVGTLEREQLRAAAAKSNEALAKLAPSVQWQQSYVAADRDVLRVPGGGRKRDTRARQTVWFSG